ncbi:phenazine biosynthesis protein PhzF family [Spongiibacter sp. IMCC21906]|uniref:PhzF family phenazine biosynthesis protein n=1 Tax=Spongiibacter sp. IMCC21906 TaxID=1620392 RepID=UPI00062DECD3|nr:PhzF family phenazine biosynthesis protein [Spongiibacter sp. IMCC21906]AKH69638.1 phenazine biosynthesis protein PhzF family [Spongiibacter sp. IMCC21906]
MQHYKIVDVFTHQAFSGAQITVFPDAGSLNDEQMQSIAKEINHSESVFVLPGQANATPELKIFSPTGPRPAGSHSCVAAAYVLAEGGHFEFTENNCHTQLTHGGAALDISLHRDGEKLHTQLSRQLQPQIDRYVPDNKELQGILGLGDHDIEQLKSRSLFVSCDTPYLIVPLRSMDAVYRARFNAEAWAQSSASSIPLSEILLYCREAEHPMADFHLRLLGPQISPQEDPPVGASVPAFAAFLREVQQLGEGSHNFWVERGKQSARQSLLKVEMLYKASAPLTVKVGGDAVLVGEGKLFAI